MYSQSRSPRHRAEGLPPIIVALLHETPQLRHCEIAKKLGCSQQLVLQTAKANGLWNREHRSLRTAQVLLLLRGQPWLLYSDIARLVGVSEQRIMTIAKDAGLWKSRKQQRTEAEALLATIKDWKDLEKRYV